MGALATYIVAHHKPPSCQMFVSATFGVGYWHTTTIYDWLSYMLSSFAQPTSPITNLDLLLYTTIFLGMQEAVLKISSVDYRHGNRSLSGIIPMFSIILLSFRVFYMGTDSKNRVLLLTKHPQLCLNLCSALFVEITTVLMLDHMTHQKC